jgi:hypothetical protein
LDEVWAANKRDSNEENKSNANTCFDTSSINGGKVASEISLLSQFFSGILWHQFQEKDTESSNSPKRELSTQRETFGSQNSSRKIVQVEPSTK